MPRNGACGVHGTIGSGAPGWAGTRGIHAASTTNAATAVAPPARALRQVFELAQRDAVIGFAGERAFERVARPFPVTQLQ